MKQGKEEGRISEKIETAKKLIKMEMTIEQIKEITGLSEEKIRKIKGEAEGF